MNGDRAPGEPTGASREPAGTSRESATVRPARPLTQFALLLAAAVVLHAVEGLFPPPAPIPGAKLGLANIATLICLATLGLRATLALTAARTVLSSVIAGGLLGFGFLLSFGAGMTSALAMGLVKLAGKDRFSLVGLSLAGAVAHNLAQLGLAALVIRHAGIIVYLPYMLLGSLPTGVLTGAAALYALRARGAALGKWLTPGRRR